MSDMTKKVVFRVVFVSVGLLLCFGAGSALAAKKPQKKLNLYLVNSGPSTAFFHDSFDCSFESLPAELSTAPGTSVRDETPGDATSFVGSSFFSYTVQAGFTIPANNKAVTLKLWAFSGDGSCPDQTVDQTMSWRLDCSGPTCVSASLSDGWQSFVIPAGTPVGTLFNESVASSSAVTVGAGDTLTLQLSIPSAGGFQWNAPNGPGASSVVVLTR
jgi:hypothetical protein